METLLLRTSTRSWQSWSVLLSNLLRVRTFDPKSIPKLKSSPLPALTNMLNIVLDQPDVAQALVATDKAEVLEGYVSEMLRLDPPIQGIYREAKVNETVGSTSLKAGDLVYVDIASANMNVSSRAFRVDNNSYSRLGACVCEAHEDRPFSSQGSLHSR